MIYEFEEYSRFLAIAGFKDFEPQDPAKLLERLRKEAPDIEIQLLDAGCVAGKDHLYFAALNAMNAFKNQTNLSRSLAVETLLYASAQRQIETAIERMGIREETRSAALVAFARQRDLLEVLLDKLPQIVRGSRDDTVLEDWTEQKIQAITTLYQIGRDEIAAISRENETREDSLRRAVIERVALLSTRI